jgi:plastocyanin
MSGVHRPGLLRRAGLIAGVLTAVSVSLVACGGASAAPTSATVTQRTFRFRPALVRVAAGSSVTWVNEDSVDHTITAGVPGSPAVSFDRPLAKRATVVIAFPAKGTFDYFCEIHNSMRGRIVVT